MLAELTVVTCSAAVVLRSSYLRPREDGQRRQGQAKPHNRPPVLISGQCTSKNIYPLVVHLFPQVRDRSSFVQVATPVTIWQNRLWLGNARFGGCVSRVRLV